MSVYYGSILKKLNEVRDRNTIEEAFEYMIFDRIHSDH
jgi:hypothetical protein